MVKTRSNARYIKPVDTPNRIFDEKMKRNKVRKISADKTHSEKDSISELLKLCRPVKVNLTRCDAMVSNSIKSLCSRK